MTDSFEPRDSSSLNGSDGHDVINFDQAKKTAKRGRPRKGLGDSGDGDHERRDSKKSKDPKTIVLAHRVAAALAHVKPIVGSAHEDLPHADTQFANIVDEHGAVVPISIATNGKVRDVAEPVIARAISDYLRRQDVLDIIDRETDGLGSLIRDFRPKYIADIMKLWENYAVCIDQKNVRMIKQKSDQGIAWEVLHYDFSEHAFDETPWFNEFLSRCGSDKTRRAIMAWVGSIFFDHADRSQYLYFYGEGENTKGRFAMALLRLLGNAANAGKEAFDPAKADLWAYANLYRRRLVVFAELGNPAFVTSAHFKGWTGDDYTTMDRKFRDHFLAKINAKFLIASNKEPYISGDKADTRRAIYVKPEPWTGVSLPDVELEKIWDAQGPGFLAQCVEVYLADCPNFERITPDREEIDELIADNEEPFIDIAERHLVFSPRLSFRFGDVEKLLKKDGRFATKDGVKTFLRVIARRYGVETNKRRCLPTIHGKYCTSLWGFAIKARAFEGVPEPSIQGSDGPEAKSLLKKLGFSSKY